MKELLFSFILLFSCTLIFSQSAEKESFLKDLRNLHSFLLAKDYAKAKECFITPRFISEEEIKEELGKLIELDEISAKGIDILENNGSFGLLRDIFPEKSERWLSRDIDFLPYEDGLPIIKIVGIDKNGNPLSAFVKKGNSTKMKKYEFDDKRIETLDPNSETINPKEAELLDKNPVTVNYYIIKPCYALKFGQAEVAAQWDGEHFRFFRLDDVGKIK